MRIFARSVACLVLFVVCRTSYGSGALTREQIARRGKDATAYVEATPRAGTAFCIHASGLFVTNEHVTRNASDRDITLVLHAGEKSEHVYHAKVVRQDAQLDLALLRVNESGSFTALPFGSNDELTELMEVVTFGFPFGRAFGGRRGQYPAISVNVHHVSSLRREEGELDKIQLDSGLNPGNSGGPVIDEHGQVVGLIQAGVFGGNLNFAIPVGKLQGFLARPDVRLIPPTIAVADLNRSVKFRATVVPLLPTKEALDVELALRAGEQPERHFRMTANGRSYDASAVPVPAEPGPARLRLIVAYGADSVSGTIADRSFQVGKRRLQFSELRELQIGGKGQAVLRDGQQVEGRITGLDDVPVHLGNAEVHFDLSKASQARIELPATVDALTCAVIVRAGGKEVGRASETVFVKGATSSGSVTGSAGVATVFGGTEPIVKPLPSAVDDVVVGGNGRYLVMHLPKVGKVAVLDAFQRRIQYLSMPDDNVKLAAGMDKLIVILPSTNLVQRWNLADLHREASATLAVKGMVKAACMGSASNGPVLVYATSGENFPVQRNQSFALLNVQTLKPLDVEVNQQQMMMPMMMMGGALRLRAAADGSVFGVWQARSTPHGLGVLVLSGNELKGRYEHTSSQYVVPGADGKILYTGVGRYTSDLRRLDEGSPMGNMGPWTLPAVGGDYYLTLKTPHQDSRPVFQPPGTRQPVEEKATVTVHLVGESRTLATLADIPLVQQPVWGQQSETLSPDQRLLFLPGAKLLVSIPLGEDRLILRPFDVEKAMEQSGIDYLLVTSRPPTKAFKGSTFTYQIRVKSRAAGVKYSIDSGPAGMTVSENGKITWPVPAEPSENEVTVIVSIHTASGQERFHTFTLSLRD